MSVVIGFYSQPTTSGILRCYMASLDCGHSQSSKGWQPFPSEIVVGTQLECETCKNYKQDAERILALTEAVFRARFTSRHGGMYHLYRRDESSPTGVMLITSVLACPEVDEALRIKGISPLSPTEERIY